jgi:phage/plasmid primase-like uncharacterized protein
MPGGVNNAAEGFRLAIAAAGLEPLEIIDAGGVIHRFSASGNGGEDSGWYVLHTDGVPAGAFGCWRLGVQSARCAKTSAEMTKVEREAHGQRVKAMQTQGDAEQTCQLYSAAHPDSLGKGIESYGTRVSNDCAVLGFHWRAKGDSGLSKATAAAAHAVGGLLAAPQFPPERPDKATAFNDLHRIRGAVTPRDAAQPRRHGKNEDGNA